MKIIYNIMPVLYEMLHDQAIEHVLGDIQQVIFPVTRLKCRVILWADSAAGLWPAGQKHYSIGLEAWSLRVRDCQ